MQPSLAPPTKHTYTFRHRKILFLDIDGVCNSAESMKTQYRRVGYAAVLGIDPYMSSLVRTIVRETGCEIVLSSTWRLSETMREEVRSVGLDFVDITPDLKGKDRGYEIEAWLEQNQDVAKYAILDDDADMLAYQAPHFFKTTFAEGLTPEIAKAVTEHLNATSTR